MDHERSLRPWSFFCGTANASGVSAPQRKGMSGLAATQHAFSDVIHNFLENGAFVLALDCYPDRDSNIVRMR